MTLTEIPTMKFPRESVEPLAVRPAAAFAMLGVGHSRGYELINSGELESYLDGSARKILVASIKAYIERRLAEAKKKRAPRTAKQKAAAATEATGTTATT